MSLSHKSLSVLRCSRYVWKSICSRSIISMQSRCWYHYDNRQQDGISFCRYTAAHHIPLRTMAGHSKWQNIRHIKADKDGVKSLINSKITARIRIAVKEGGGADPKYNVQLSRVLAEAKSKDVPNVTIDNALKAAVSSSEAAAHMTVEAKGPGGCMLIIEAYAEKLPKTRMDIQGIVRRLGGKVGNDGIAMHVFDRKGVILVTCPDATDIDAYVDVAIECGAEEVMFDKDEDDQTILKFLCGPKDLHAVRKELETQNFEVQSSEVEYLPVHTVPLSEGDLANAETLIMKLMKKSEVMKVYDNIAVPES